MLLCVIIVIVIVDVDVDVVLVAVVDFSVRFFFVTANLINQFQW